MTMKQDITALLQESAQVKAAVATDPEFTNTLSAIEQTLRATIACGGTIYACGNGGSACDAMHLTEELVARFKRERPGIRAMHFLDAGTLTCWSNDYDFQSVFERQAHTFCRKGDTLVAFSTSGNSKNVVRAVQAANELGASTIALTGIGGGALKNLATHCLEVPSKATERIQEVHITVVHVLLELLECS